VTFSISNMSRLFCQRIIWVLLLAALVCVAGTAHAGTLFQDDFGDSTITGWTKLAGADANETGGVFVIPSNTDTHYKITAGDSWTDYTFSAEVKGVDNDRSGITFRITDASNYYLLRQEFGGANWNFHLQKVVSGGQTDLATAINNYGTDTGQVNSQTTFYTLKVVISGTSIKAYVDDVLKFDVTDSTYSTGSAGLWTDSQTNAEFDDALVTNGSAAKKWGECSDCDYTGVTEDNYLDQGQTTYNMGATTYVRVGDQNVGGGRPARTLIKFNLNALDSLIVSASDIISASLKFRSYDVAGSSVTVDTYRVKKNWNGGNTDYAVANDSADESTWNYQYYNETLWATAGCDGSADRETFANDSTTVSSNETWYTWDVTLTVKNMYTDGNDFGWVLVDQDEGDTTQRKWRFYSSDHATTTSRPYLEIEYNSSSNSAPTAPSTLYSNNDNAQSGQTNPTGITDSTPAFSAIYNDPDSSDIANKYRIQVDDNSDFSSTLWDSGAPGTSMTNTTQGNRSPDITYAGSALANNTTYYWRIKFWDDQPAEGAWSTPAQTFQTGTLSGGGSGTYVVSVEYVPITLSGTSASANLTKGQTIANCVPFVTSNFASITDFDSILADIYFESGPKVTATRSASSGTVNLGIYVVEFDPSKVKVQQGTISSFAGTSSTSSLGASVDQGKAALVFYYKSGGNSEWAQSSVAGWFSANNTLSWQRDDTGGNIAGTYYVFEALNSEFSVQAKSFSMAAGSASANVSINSIDMTKTFLTASYRTNRPKDESDRCSPEVYLNSATQINASRYDGSTYAISDIRVFAITFAGDETVQRGSFSYGQSDTSKNTTLTSAVDTDLAIAWNIVNKQGSMKSDDNNQLYHHSAFQRLTLIESGTKVQGERGGANETGNAGAVGRWEVIEWPSATGQAWWDSNYSYVRQLTLTAPATKAVPNDYPVKYSFDHAAMVTAGHAESNGVDLRVVYYDGSSWTEVDRILFNDNINNSSWNQSNTTIMFKTQAAISAAGSDAGYYLYYGYASATSPPTDTLSSRYFLAQDLTGGSTSSTTYATIETLTFTPSSTSEHWVVVATWRQQDPGAGGSQQVLGWGRISLNGSPRTGTDDITFEMSDNTWKTFHAFLKVTGTTAQQTVTIDFRAQGGTDAWDDARIMAFMIPDPPNADIQYDDSQLATVTDKVSVDTVCEYIDSQTLSFSPSSAGDYIWLANGFMHEGPGGASCGGLYATDEGGNDQQKSSETYISTSPEGFVPLVHFEKRTLTTGTKNFKIRHRPDPDITKGSDRQGLTQLLFRADVFDAVETADSATQSTTTSTSYQTKATLTTATQSAAHDYVYLVSMMQDDASGGSITLSTFAEVRLAGTQQLEDEKAIGRSSYDSQIAWAWAENNTGNRTVDTRYKAESTVTAESQYAHITALRYIEPTYSLAAEAGPTAIGLLSFKATGAGNDVRVDWHTGHEIANLGFNIYRAPSKGGPYTKINSALIPGLNYSALGKTYSFMDTDVSPGRLYYYKLEDIDVYGKHTFHGPVCVDWDADGLPDDWEIRYGLNPWVNDADIDSDGDGLTNREEYELGTDPFNPDTDGDGILDGQEFGVVEQPDEDGSRVLTRGVEVIDEDDSGVTLELLTEGFDTELIDVDGQEFERLRIADYIHGYTSQIGQPEMPLKGILIDLPAGMAASLSVLETEVETHFGYQIFPVPEPIVDAEGAAAAVGESFVQDEAAYLQDAFYPQDVAELIEVYTFRDQVKQQLVFYPISFNAATGDLRHYKRIRVRIDYVEDYLAKASDINPTPWKVPVADSSFTEQISSMGSVAMAFGASPLIVNPLSPALSSLGVILSAVWAPPADSGGTAYKILTSEAGIYRIKRSDLALDDDLSAIRLYNLGEEVAIHIYDQNSDNYLDAGDYIEFYAQPVDAAYAKDAKENVYWLVTSAGSGSPKRMPAVDGSPTGGALGTAHSYLQHEEQDARYMGLAPGEDGLDRWYYYQYVLGIGFSGGPDPVPYDFALPVFGNQAPGSLTVSLWGYSDTDHDLEVWVNGVYKDTFYWSGITYNEVSIDAVDVKDSVLDQSAQSATLNTIILAAGASAVDDIYNDMLIEITAGTGSDQVRKIIDYNGATKVATVESNWDTTPDASSIYRIDTAVTLICDSGDDAFVLDWMEFSYERSFAAVNDSLQFAHDSGYRYIIDDFSTNDLLIFDISDPTDVATIENAVISGSNPYSIEFEPPINPGASETYLIISASDYKSPLSISQNTSSDLADTDNEADYILITHQDIGWDGAGDPYGWLDDLVALRQAQGLQVKVVDVADIYDEFSYGLQSAVAMRDFLAYAYANWQTPAPQYVLLVGDASFDYKDNLNIGTINYVPGYMVVADYMGEAITDEYFVRISGDDAIPDMYIGRLPAESQAQAASMVAKIKDYEETSHQKDWRQKVLLVADDQNEAYEVVFETMNEDAIALLPSKMLPLRGYLESSTPAAIAAFIDTNIGSGALIMNYSGHGAMQSWASPAIFADTAVADLDNSGKYPFVISMSCLTGNFGFVSASKGQEPSLAEVLLQADSEGAVAALMPTAMTTTGGQHILNTALFEAFFSDDIRELGPAILAAKQVLLANGSSDYEQISETFLLFGDPAMALKIPLPRMPTGVAAYREENGVRISWNAALDSNGNAVAGYHVYRASSAAGPYSKISTELVSGTEFSDTSGVVGVDAGAGGGGYYYAVSSEDDDGDESAQSLGISPASLASTGSNMLGCFIGAAAQAMPHKGLWVISLLTICLLIGIRFRIQRFRGSMLKKGE